MVGLQFGEYVGKRKGLGKKVALKQRFEGGERLSHADIYLAEESSRKEEWQVQRP